MAVLLQNLTYLFLAIFYIELGLAKEHYGENKYRIDILCFTYAEMLFARDKVELLYNMHEEILEQRRKELG